VDAAEHEARLRSWLEAGLPLSSAMNLGEFAAGGGEAPSLRFL